MLLTEDEATCRRCCGPADCGSEDFVSKERFCLASTCMAWRWGSGREVGTDRRCERCNGSGVIGGEECEGCVAGYQTEIVPDGFCGLATKPED